MPGNGDSWALVVLVVLFAIATLILLAVFPR